MNCRVNDIIVTGSLENIQLLLSIEGSEVVVEIISGEITQIAVKEGDKKETQVLINKYIKELNKDVIDCLHINTFGFLQPFSKVVEYRPYVYGLVPNKDISKKVQDLLLINNPYYVKVPLEDKESCCVVSRKDLDSLDTTFATYISRLCDLS